MSVNLKKFYKMKEKTFKAVLVDFDGTLFDTWKNPYTQEGKKGKIDWKEVEKNIPNCPLYEGWREVFAWLKTNNIPIGIVSHCTKGYITKTLKYWKLTDVFKCVLTRYGLGTRYTGKVSKDELMRLALENEDFKGIHPSEVLYLSDQAKDMPVTRLAGLEPVGCLWGSKEKEELLNAHCSILTSPSLLLSMLNRNK